jgi:hypothetical protein
MDWAKAFNRLGAILVLIELVIDRLHHPTDVDPAVHILDYVRRIYARHSG